MKLVTIKTRFDKVAVEAADTDVKSNNNNNFKSLTSVKFSIIYIIIQEVLNITHFTLKSKTKYL